VSITDTLLETAKADTELLQTADGNGDILAKPRVVTFLLIADTKELADLVASFIYDNRYGTCNVEPYDQEFGIFVRITMPIQQNIICAISGLFACVSAIFKVEYDGWESEIQRAS
jgi:regulator of ribonuclease activity B